MNAKEMEMKFNRTALSMMEDIYCSLSLICDVLDLERIKNPALIFTKAAKAGEYDHASDDTYDKLLDAAVSLSVFWNDKPDVSLTQLARNIVALDGCCPEGDLARDVFKDACRDYQIYSRAAGDESVTWTVDHCLTDAELDDMSIEDARFDSGSDILGGNEHE